MNKQNKFLAVALSLGLAASSMQAATIAWGAAQDVTLSDASQVSTNGTLLYGVNFGGISTVINGVFFESTTGSNFTNVSFSDVADGYKTQDRTDNLPGGATTSDPVVDYGDLLRTIQFNGDVGDSYTLNGLTNGNQYEIQIWSSDARYGATQQQWIDGNPLNTQTGQYMIGTFIADATTQSFSVTTPGTGSNSGLVNGLQVRSVAIPEPSTFALLLGAGALGVMVLRRRRQA